MARTSWLDEKDEKAGAPIFQKQIEKLESFTTAMADGVVTTQELAGQEKRLIEAMKGVESELSDALHAKTTTLLVELTAYNIMRLLHELQAERARIAFR
jgi:hypothetical protein